MLWRFCLYGFLKNQQYYEPFFMLALLQKGLGFTLFGITFEPFTVFGLLIGFREVMVNLMEIPSGAVADVWGRRRSMMLSFCAYIVSFAIFGLAKGVGLLFVAMFFFAIGDAFRTGTHKAMIFAWLRLQGRIDERTKVYGYTRSWSKLGSALSVVLAAAFVFASRDYVSIFYFSIIPYVLGLVNFLGYPRELDGERHAVASLGTIVTHLKESLVVSVRNRSLRRIILESMGFEGFFKAAKDYLQPILKCAAILLVARFVTTGGLTDHQKTALLAGPVYFVLFILSAMASRNAHRLVSRPGGEDRTARLLWGCMVIIFAGLLPAMVFNLRAAMIGGFIALFVLQNVWRPVLISRVGAHSDEAKAATVLSIESQAKSISTMLIAPALGLAVDLVNRADLADKADRLYWPVGLLGLIIALAFFLTARRGSGRDS